MDYYNYENELYHHGILGMKWGVRRFQNSDGSLKPAGEKRYGSVEAIGQAIKDHKVAVRRKKNLEKARKARVEKKKAAEEAKKVAAERAELIAKGKIRPKDMTQDELNARITRLESERRLKDLERQTFEASSGKKFVDGLMTKVITPAATSAGEQFLRKALNKVGDDVLAEWDKQQSSKDPKKNRQARIDKLKDEWTELDYKKKIDDLKNPKSSVADEVREWENKRKLEYLQDDDYQTKKRESERVGFDRKINDPKYKDPEDNKKKDENNNGFPDDEEEKDK